MDLKEMKKMINYLVKAYCPEGTIFYWHNDRRNAIGFCKCKYCESLKEFYDYEVAVSTKYARSHSWKEVRRIAVQEIAHSRTLGKGKKAFFDEFSRLMSIIEKSEKDEKKAA